MVLVLLSFCGEGGLAEGARGIDVVVATEVFALGFAFSLILNGESVEVINGRVDGALEVHAILIHYEISIVFDLLTV